MIRIIDAEEITTEKQKEIIRLSNRYLAAIMRVINVAAADHETLGMAPAALCLATARACSNIAASLPIDAQLEFQARCVKTLDMAMTADYNAKFNIGDRNEH